MAIMKPEMKSYIWLETPDGSIQQVEQEVAMFCPMICREVVQAGMGSSKNYAIKLPERVTPSVLGLILDYCRFHQLSGRSNKERKSFDEKFIRLDTKKLCDLISGADSLRLRPLVDLTSRALARKIEGRTPEEIRDTFNLPDDLTEEEKLEPLKIKTDDPRIRLLNRLYAKKRQELKARQTLKNVEIEEERVDDNRSVDDLLLFINSGDEDSKGVKSGKNKKKNRRRKDHSKEEHKKETDSSSELLLGNNSSLEFDFDDELDPEMKEQLDREVEDFARRLNSVWPERVQGLIPLDQDRSRIIAPLSWNV